MFDALQKPKREYTKTIALLVLAFIFSPAVVIASSPVAYVFIVLAVAFSALCAAWAWADWKKRPPFTPSIVDHNTATRAVALLWLVGASILTAGDFSSYRGLKLGMNLDAAAKAVGAKPAEGRLVHQRPAVIQEMDWQPRSPDSARADPVKDGLLYFCNGQLFRIVVTYDRYRVEGLTAADIIEGISATYGLATRPTAEIAYHSNYGEVAAVIARWEDPEYSYNLVRSGDQSSYVLILYSKRLDADAQAAIVESLQLDAQEAPQRDLEKQRKHDEEQRLVLEKARSKNKPNFRP